MLPTNLITGFLGVGKTTAVLDLLKRKPGDARWAVLVNEFGEVPVDGAVLAAAGGGRVLEVAGGCVCCVSVDEFNYALREIVTELRPERLLIESTGLGHPARVLDLLRGPDYGDLVDVRATVGLVAPGDFASPGYRDSPVFLDQAHLADVLVLNKADRADAALVAEFRAWAAGLFPPKSLVGVTTFGRLDPAWLDAAVPGPRVPLFPDAHPPGHAHRPEWAEWPSPGRPVRRPSPGDPPPACGWLFSPADVFAEEGLLTLAAGDPAVTRLKGVFRVGGGEWVFVNRRGADVTVSPINYRRDSRVEVFAGYDAAGWAAFERRLMACVTGG